jgi:hypothetical protein
MKPRISLFKVLCLTGCLCGLDAFQLQYHDEAYQKQVAAGVCGVLIACGAIYGIWRLASPAHSKSGSHSKGQGSSRSGGGGSGVSPGRQPQDQRRSTPLPKNQSGGGSQEENDQRIGADESGRVVRPGGGSQEENDQRIGADESGRVVRPGGGSQEENPHTVPWPKLLSDDDSAVGLLTAFFSASKATSMRMKPLTRGVFLERIRQLKLDLTDAEGISKFVSKFLLGTASFLFSVDGIFESLGSNFPPRAGVEQILKDSGFESDRYKLESNYLDHNFFGYDLEFKTWSSYSSLTGSLKKLLSDPLLSIALMRTLNDQNPNIAADAVKVLQTMMNALPKTGETDSQKLKGELEGKEREYAALRSKILDLGEWHDNGLIAKLFDLNIDKLQSSKEKDFKRFLSIALSIDDQTKKALSKDNAEQIDKFVGYIDEFTSDFKERKDCAQEGTARQLFAGLKDYQAASLESLRTQIPCLLYDRMAMTKWKSEKSEMGRIVSKIKFDLKLLELKSSIGRLKERIDQSHSLAALLSMRIDRSECAKLLTECVDAIEGGAVRTRMRANTTTFNGAFINAH